MKWLIEQIIEWFKGRSGRQAETRADFAAVSTQWEALFGKLSDRMKRDEERFDAVESRLTQQAEANLQHRRDCEEKLAIVLTRITELELKKGNQT